MRSPEQLRPNRASPVWDWAVWPILTDTDLDDIHAVLAAEAAASGRDPYRSIGRVLDVIARRHQTR